LIFSHRKRHVSNENLSSVPKWIRVLVLWRADSLLYLQRTTFSRILIISVPVIVFTSWPTSRTSSFRTKISLIFTPKLITTKSVSQVSKTTPKFFILVTRSTMIVPHVIVEVVTFILHFLIISPALLISIITSFSTIVFLVRGSFVTSRIGRCLIYFHKHFSSLKDFLVKMSHCILRILRIPVFNNSKSNPNFSILEFYRPDFTLNF